MTAAQPLRGERLVIGHLFADLLNLYGDRGNVEALARRAEWRGAEVDIRQIGEDQPDALAGVDIVFIGGGPDALQVLVADALPAVADALETAVGRGAALLAVCGGYQNLGRKFGSDALGMSAGLGLFDVRTKIPSDAERYVGGIVVELEPGSPITALGQPSAAAAGLPGAASRLVGFENHGGRTVLGPDATPLGRVVVGRGNNGMDGFEGVLAMPGEGGLAGLRIGTYLHGPLLPRNPHLADFLLASAGGGRLRDGITPLPDDAEWRAHQAFADRWLATLRPTRHRPGGRLFRRIGSLIGS